MMFQDYYFQSPTGSAENLNFAKIASVEKLSAVRDRKPDKNGHINAPIIHLGDFVLLPQAIGPYFLAKDEPALEVLQEAYRNDSTFFASFGDTPFASETSVDMYEICLEMAVANILESAQERFTILLQARRRIQILNVDQRDDAFYAQAVPVVDKHRKTQKLTALLRLVSKDYKQYAEMVSYISDEVTYLVDNSQDPGSLADFIASTLELPSETRLAYLLETDGLARLNAVHLRLKREIRLLHLEDDIQSKVQDQLDKSSRENYLRDQIAILQKELSESQFADPDVQKLSTAIQEKNLPLEVKETALKELDRLKNATPLSPENGMIQNYLQWIVDLPWTEETEDNLDVQHAQTILDENHYGLQKAKDRILEYLAVRNLKPKRNRQPILCFVGPPGTGKTSLGKSIASAIDRKFVRVSLGGVHDEAEIRGHRRTYLSALPGRVLQTMRKAGVVNPLFMLDEIDKLGTDFQGDPSSALLEVLDPEQNYSFSDHFLEVPYDLSKVLFITTANSVANIPPALLDRMELVEFPGYIVEEKIAIARQFLIPKQIEENGLEDERIHFSDEALQAIIEGYTYEAGVRNLEREISSVLRKIARAKSEGKEVPREVNGDMVQTYLGPVEFFMTLAEGSDEIGVATAIAWTENGGEIMPVEVLVIKGKGNLQITGQIGDVMQESAQAALTYLKSKSELFEIDDDYFEEVDVHIHIPEGSIPKDGPSAGITLATALTSAVLGIPIHHELAMTGEITLRGRVLAIGGVREKVLAAHRSGIKTVLLPRKNQKDLADVPKQILEEMDIQLVEHMDEVLAQALVAKPINTRHKAPGTKKKKSTSKDSDVPG